MLTATPPPPPPPLPPLLPPADDVLLRRDAAPSKIVGTRPSTADVTAREKTRPDDAPVARDEGEASPHADADFDSPRDSPRDSARGDVASARRRSNAVAAMSPRDEVLAAMAARAVAALERAMAPRVGAGEGGKDGAEAGWKDGAEAVVGWEEFFAEVRLGVDEQGMQTPVRSGQRKRWSLCMSQMGSEDSNAGKENGGESMTLFRKSKRFRADKGEAVEGGATPGTKMAAQSLLSLMR